MKRVRNFSPQRCGRTLYLGLIKIFENSEGIIGSMEHVLPGVQVVQLPVPNISSVSCDFSPIESWQIKFLEEILTNFLLFRQCSINPVVFCHREVYYRQYEGQRKFSHFLRRLELTGGTELIN